MTKHNLSCGVSITTEKMNKKVVYLARCEELGVSDFGDTVEESLKNLKSAIKLLIQVEPSKQQRLKEENLFLTTRIFL
ncbi:MAG: type II toxin-antitoxin system HicB family antitoxin [Nanoarchaeota archaeon]|nr:type II toxin-antitoxin system HicB family antitoxin [Nanoarchaeota archaeon]